MFTFSCRAFMNSTSTGRSLWERNRPCEHWDWSNQNPPHEIQLDCATPCRKPAGGKGVVCVVSLHHWPCATFVCLYLCVCLCVITRARMEGWSRGSSGLCCPGCSFCSARSHPWSIAQTADLCSLWSASSWNTSTHTHIHTLAAPPGWIWHTCQSGRSSSSPLVVVDSVSEPRRVDDG